MPAGTPALPTIIIFDVDGVLVDVRGSFHRTLIETLRYFTGKRVTSAEVHAWKNRGGFNDDWKLSHAWIQSLGFQNSYEEVKQKFQEIYWGDGRSGNVKRERWLLPRPTLKRLAKNSELAIFTGRVRQELDYTLDRNKLRSFFKSIVTVENVTHGKPDPDGLHIILDGRDPSTAIYLGDNIDDARASQAARVPFIGVLPYRSEARRHRAASLQELGARTILGSVRQLESWLVKNSRHT
jgi:HAD superfamily phosphatase